MSVQLHKENNSKTLFSVAFKAPLRDGSRPTKGHLLLEKSHPEHQKEADEGPCSAAGLEMHRVSKPDSSCSIIM